MPVHLVLALNIETDYKKCCVCVCVGGGGGGGGGGCWYLYQGHSGKFCE